MSEAELKRNKKRRQANINVLCGLITKAKDIITAEDDNIEKDKVITALLKAIRKKKTVIESLNEEIINVIDEDSIEEEIDNTTNNQVKVTKEIDDIELFVVIM